MILKYGNIYKYMISRKYSLSTNHCTVENTHHNQTAKCVKIGVKLMAINSVNQYKRGKKKKDKREKQVPYG